MNSKKTRAMSVFFPFWCIISHGRIWLISTLGVALLLDGAVLITLLLLFRERGGSPTRGIDAGNVWRRAIIPVFLVDIFASFASAGFLRLVIFLLSRIPGLDGQYLLLTVSSAPATDLFTLIPAVLSVLVGLVIIFAADRYIVLAGVRRGGLIAFLLAVCTAPYSLLFPTLFN